MSGPVFDAVRGPAGYDNVVVDAGAVALPIPVVTPPPAAVLLMSRGGNSFWRDDGVDPTTTDGFPLLADSTFYYVGNLSNMKVIGEAGAVLHCSFYY